MERKSNLEQHTYMIYSKVLIADFCLLFVAIIWGASYAVAKDILTVSTVSALIFFRFLIAFIVLLPVCIDDFRKIRKTDLSRGVLLGCILSSIFCAETIGVLYTTATNAAFLISLCIIFTPILDSLIQGRHPPLPIMGCAALSLMGTGLMVSNDSGLSLNIGDIFIIGAAGLRAIMVVSTKRLFSEKPISSGTLTVIQIGTVTFLSGLLVLITQGVEGFVPSTGVKFWSGLLFLALFCTLAAFFIQNWAVRRTNPTRVGFLMGTEPLFGALFATLILGEHLTTLDALGATMILTGTYMGARKAHTVSG